MVQALPSPAVPFETHAAANGDVASTRRGAGADRGVLALRHGESEWNATGRWQGQADPPLTANGERQAVLAGRELAADGPWAAIAASDLRRASRTAEIIGEVIGTEVRALDERLRENHAGEWEGLTRSDIDRQWPGVLAAEGRPPGFEPYEQTVARMHAALIDLAGLVEPGQQVLIIGHSGAIRSLRRSLGGDDRRIPNLGGFWFAVNGSSIGNGSMVTLLERDTSPVE
jgi:broad specificity phosphatase PhoE